MSEPADPVLGGETRDRLEAIREWAAWELSLLEQFALTCGNAPEHYAPDKRARYADVLWLLGEVSRLRERVKELEGVVEEIMGEHGFEPEPPSVEGSPDP